MTFKMVSRWLRDDEFQHFMVFFVWKLATPNSNGFSSSSLFFDGHFEKPRVDTEFAQHDTCHPKRMAGWFRRVWSAKLVQITPITMVYGTQITIVIGAYKPTYNWGAPHCIYIYIYIDGVHKPTYFYHDFPRFSHRMTNINGVPV